MVMVRRCVSGFCSNTHKNNVSLHSFPKDPELKQKWSEFICLTRADWTSPAQFSCLCSAHFTPDCFEDRPRYMVSLGFDVKCKNVLKPGAIPTLTNRPHRGIDRSKATDTCSSTNSPDRKPLVQFKLLNQPQNICLNMELENRTESQRSKRHDQTLTDELANKMHGESLSQCDVNVPKADLAIDRVKMKRFKQVAPRDLALTAQIQDAGEEMPADKPFPVAMFKSVFCRSRGRKRLIEDCLPTGLRESEIPKAQCEASLGSANLKEQCDKKLLRCQFLKCSYRTASEADLRRHAQTHSVGKPHKCPDCSYKTADKTHLRDHKHRHTGEKPHRCSLCPFSTANASNLRQHVKKVHTG